MRAALRHKKGGQRLLKYLLHIVDIDQSTSLDLWESEL